MINNVSFQVNIPRTELETKIENGKHLSFRLFDPSSVDPSSVDPSSVDPSSVDPSSVGGTNHLIRLDVTPFLVAKNLLNVSPVDSSPNFMPILSGQQLRKVRTLADFG